MMFKQIFLLVSALAVIELSLSQQCDIKFLRYSSEHTACLQSSTVGSGVTESQRDHIVERHNFFRSHVYMYNNQTNATNMQKMYWDEELAMIAQKWADNCEWKHDENFNRDVPGSYPVGQNLARGQSDWTNAIQDWQDEVKFLNFGVSGTPGEMIGHYTQLVWADSSRIGCGFTNCDFGPMYVCNYAPGGNSMSEIFSPYKSGVRGSDCAAQYRKNGLCDCGGKVCKNGGELDLQTCECKCKDKPWIIGSDCGLDCSGAIDHAVCGNEWKFETCQKYSNIPYEHCPMMCNLCPGPNAVQNTAAPTTVPSASGLPPCTFIEPPKCGQMGGPFWPRDYCRYDDVVSGCPAMCGKCSAAHCENHNNKIYSVGSEWRNTFGTFECTTAGVLLERACYVEPLNLMLKVGDTSPSYQSDGYTWSCTCHSRYLKTCTGQRSGL